MHKGKYEKPSFNEVNIEMNDLCAGSKPINTTIIVKTKAMEKRSTKVDFRKGKTEGMWHSDF